MTSNESGVKRTGQIKRLQLAIELLTSRYGAEEEEMNTTDEESDSDRSLSLSNLEEASSINVGHATELSSFFNIAELICRKKSPSETFTEAQDPFPVVPTTCPVQHNLSKNAENLCSMDNCKDSPKFSDLYRGNCLIKKPFQESQTEKMTGLSLSQILSASSQQ